MLGLLRVWSMMLLVFVFVRGLLRWGSAFVVVPGVVVGVGWAALVSVCSVVRYVAWSERMVLMRKSELVVGEEYAFGRSGSYDRWRLERVELVELDGRREVRGRWRRGIVVRFVDGSVGWPRRSAGEEAVLDTARGLQQLWATYAPLRAAHDGKQRARAEEESRLREEVRALEIRLNMLGFREGFRASRLDFTVSPAALAGLLDRVERAELDEIDAVSVLDEASS